MNVLILSCGTGQGHNSAAAAVQEALVKQGVPCQTKDAFRFISHRVSTLMNNGHAFMYRHFPRVFRFGYRYAENHSGVFRGRSPVYKFLTHGTEALYQHCVDQGYDVVICTHVLTALMMTAVLDRYPLNVKTYFVATDYTCSPSMSESRMDGYFIPDESLCGEFAANVPAEALIPCGIPVRSAFRTRMDKAAAKEAEGIAPGHQHLVMMCGSMGCGPMEKLARALAETLTTEQEVSIVCGTNRKLAERMREDLSSHENIHVLGYVENISRLMDSADLYVTKPGGISVSESAAKCLPMVCINAVAGCETYNMNFYIRHGGAVTADDTAQLAALCQKLLADEEQLAQMSAALEVCGHPDAADAICAHLLQQAVK